MRRDGAYGRSERGSTLVEFTIGALVFLTAIFGVLDFSRLLWTHNALSDSVRRAARYAVSHASADETTVKNIAVYGNAEGTGQPRSPSGDQHDLRKCQAEYRLQCCQNRSIHAQQSLLKVGLGYSRSGHGDERRRRSEPPR